MDLKSAISLNRTKASLITFYGNSYNKYRNCRMNIIGKTEMPLSGFIVYLENKVTDSHKKTYIIINSSC